MISQKVKTFLMSDGLYYGTYDVMGAFLAIHITTQIENGSSSMVGFVIAYGLFLRPFVELPLAKISKRFSFKQKVQIVGWGTVGSGVLLFLMGQATQMWHVFLIQTFFSITEATSFPLKWGIFSRILDRDNVEFEWTLEDLVTIIPAMISSVLAGVISVIWGFPSLFLFFGTLYVGSGIMFLFIDRHQKLLGKSHRKS